MLNKDEEIKIILNDTDRMTDTDPFSTCESQVMKKNEFFLTKTEKLLSYSKSIRIC
jgi:hypothetical protein